VDGDLDMGNLAKGSDDEREVALAPEKGVNGSERPAAAVVSTGGWVLDIDEGDGRLTPVVGAGTPVSICKSE
jgi:hypothetical protein